MRELTSTYLCGFFKNFYLIPLGYDRGLKTTHGDVEKYRNIAERKNRVDRPGTIKYFRTRKNVSFYSFFFLY